MRQIHLTTSLASHRLHVIVIQGQRRKEYNPKSASAHRLHMALSALPVFSVYVDHFGPSVFYNVPKPARAVCPPPGR